MAPPPWAPMHMAPEPARARLGEQVPPGHPLVLVLGWVPGWVPGASPTGRAAGGRKTELAPSSIRGKTIPALANGGVWSPPCLQPPCQCHGHGEAPVKHGAGGPISTLAFKNLHEDQLSYLTWSGHVPLALPTDGQSPDPAAAMGRGPLPSFSPLAASPWGKSSLPAPPRDRPAFCKASAALAAMRSRCPAHGQATRPQRRPMPARLFSLKVNKKATLKLPGAAGEAFTGAMQREGTSRRPYQRGDSRAVPLAGTLPLRSP